jgi:hypothetical protein
MGAAQRPIYLVPSDLIKVVCHSAPGSSLKQQLTRRHRTRRSGGYGHELVSVDRINLLRGFVYRSR